MAGEVLRRISTVQLAWGDPSHFDREQPLPCRFGDGPTRMRDDNGKACHLRCAEEELAQRIAVERFGSCSAPELRQELTGHAPPVVGERTRALPGRPAPIHAPRR